MGNAKEKGDPEATIDLKPGLPDYAEGYCDLGVALLLLNQTEQAIVSYEKAISLKKDLKCSNIWSRKCTC